MLLHGNYSTEACTQINTNGGSTQSCCMHEWSRSYLIILSQSTRGG